MRRSGLRRVEIYQFSVRWLGVPRCSNRTQKLLLAAGVPPRLAFGRFGTPGGIPGAILELPRDHFVPSWSLLGAQNYTDAQH